MFGISFDPPADNLAFRDRHELPFTLLSDTDRSVGALYQALRSPEDAYANFPLRISYLIDPDGIVNRTYEVTDPAGHGAEVLADLEAAQR